MWKPLAKNAAMVALLLPVLVSAYVAQADAYDCGTCTGCLWVSTRSCYIWPQDVCNRYSGDGYAWCGNNPSPPPAPPTPSPSSAPSPVWTPNSRCGTCQGCLWEKYNACYMDWSQTTCNRYSSDGYIYCPGSTTPTASPTASLAPSKSPNPTPIKTPTVSPSKAPTTVPSRTPSKSPSPSVDPVCGACKGCLWIAAMACYPWSEGICSRYYGDGYIYCGANPAPTASSTPKPSTVPIPTPSSTSMPIPTACPLPSPTPDDKKGYNYVVNPEPKYSMKIAELLSASDFEALFPHSGEAPCQTPAALTYLNLLQAAAHFPEFCATGDLETRKRELAAFFGQTSQETSGWWPGQPYEWGYCFYEEVGCAPNHCGGYQNCNGECGDIPNGIYPCAPSKQYYGRGAIQLSWNFNYFLASYDMFNDTRLIYYPELVSSDGVLAFQTAIWFWMRPQNPKPSCHDVMVGKWIPSLSDLQKGRVAGYGMTTNVINGGLECGYATPEKVKNRVNYYVTYANILNVDPGAESTLYCDKMRSY